MNPPPFPEPTETGETRTTEPPLPESLDLRTLFEGLLRRPHDLVERLARPGHGATLRFSLLALVSLLLFGLVLGCFAKHEQLWAAPLKLAVGLSIASVICFPSLYIFSTLAGGRISVSQIAAFLAGAVALAGLLLLGFAPAVWIFAESTDSFGFMGALAVGSWLIAVLFGLRFLKAAVIAAGGTQKGPLIIWSVIFLLVTLQMTTSLRPILGRSPVLLTNEKKFFLQHWGDCLGMEQGDHRPDPASTPSLRGANPAPPADGAANPFSRD